MKHLLTLFFFGLWIGTFYEGVGQTYVPFPALKKEINQSKGCKEANEIFIKAELIKQDNPTEAISWGRKALAFAQKNDCKLITIECYQLIGNGYDLGGNAEKALEYYQLSLKICEQVGADALTLKASVLGNVGLVFSDRGDYPRAMYYALQALPILEQLEDYYNLSSVYNHIGSIYAFQERYDSALVYFKQSYQIGSKLKAQEGLSYILANMGSIYLIQKKYDQAEKSYREALTFVQKYKMLESECNIYLNLGNLSIEMRRWKDAKDYLTKALAITDNNNYLSTKTKILITFGQLEQEQKNYIDALKYFDQADAIAQKLGLKHDRMTVAEMKYKLYKTQKQWETATRYLEDYHQFKDSVLHQSKLEEIGRLKGRYQMEHEFLQQENKRKKEEEQKYRTINRQYLFIFSGVLVLVIGLLFIARLPIRPWIWNLLVFLSFMLLFEAVLIYVDALLTPYTDGKPLPTLLINFVLAGIFTGIHHVLQHKLDLFYVRSAVELRALRRWRSKKK